MAFTILSIDGGGMKGIIPLMILEQLELKSGKSIADLFDLIAGTLTGGLIASALVLKSEENPTLSKYSASEILKLYEEKAVQIFDRNFLARYWPIPNKWLPDNLFLPRYRKEGIEKVINELLADKTLNDCRQPVLICAYNITNHHPIYFTNRFSNETSYEYKGFQAQQNLRLMDICRATSAAPTYFPPHHFNLNDSITQTRSDISCVDGGVFINNPSLAAFIELYKYKNDPIYTKGGIYTINPLKDVHILSLNTGYDGTLKAIDATSWGYGDGKNISLT